MFYFIRHGNTDYSERDTKIYQGFGNHLAPLSEKGIAQIKKTARDERLKDADLILSSPYTRALQSAAILSKELGLDIVIETDLYEWLANKQFIYEDDAAAQENYQEYSLLGGHYPQGEERLWESTEIIRRRVTAVLEKYAHHRKVLVVCHGMLIQAVTGHGHPHTGEIVEFSL